MPSPQSPDVLIAGAGIIGLSLALELHRRGAHVTVLDRGSALAEASTAAAGMLAATDPDNPPTLRPLSDLSLRLYPDFLARIEHLSGQPVPLQTSSTLQQTYPTTATVPAAELDQLLPGHALGHIPFTRLAEHSLDPRQLASALLAAVRATPITLLENTSVLGVTPAADTISLRTTRGTHTAPFFVESTGAWARTDDLAPTLPVFPVKGQMLSVAIPPTFPFTLTLRTHGLYIVPRTTGPNRGRAVIGATVEIAGYTKSTTDETIRKLHDRACTLLPPLRNAPILEQWAGLRPATHDRLPILGAHPRSPRHLFATAHFRNGILLAPATATILADLLSGLAPLINLAPFSPTRTSIP